MRYDGPWDYQDLVAAIESSMRGTTMRSAAGKTGA